MYLSINSQSISVLLFMLVCLIGSAQCAELGRGRINMKGSIIDTACAIDLDSQYQDIGMPTLPLGSIVRDQQGPDVPFTIRLVNCTLKRWKPDRPDWVSLQVTFDGAAEGDNLFRLEGDASGIGLQIADTYGVTAQPGVAMPARPLQEDSMRLDYVLRLMATQDAPIIGYYHTTLRFKVDYL